jgi:hypothetical protein
MKIHFYVFLNEQQKQAERILHTILSTNMTHSLQIVGTKALNVGLSRFWIAWVTGRGAGKFRFMSNPRLPLEHAENQAAARDTCFYKWPQEGQPTISMTYEKFPHQIFPENRIGKAMGSGQKIIFEVALPDSRKPARESGSWRAECAAGRPARAQGRQRWFLETLFWMDL